MPLTDVAIRKAAPPEKPTKHFDGGGLFLLHNPNGSKWWRLKYRYGGKEKQLSLGVYPEVSLKEAREQRDEARKLLSKGVDPGETRRIAKTINAPDSTKSFRVIALEWHARQATRWSERHAIRIMQRLENDLFPLLGQRPVDEIKAPELLSVLQRKEGKGAYYSARRLNQIADQVFRYAIATGRTEVNPAPNLKGALHQIKKTHLAAITDPKKVGPLLRAINGYDGSIVTRAALKLAPLVFVRPGELRHAEWSEIDLDAAEWTIPGHKMKMGVAHLVPLSRQAVAIFREIQPYSGKGRYVFPSPRTDTRPISDNAVLSALRRMGYEKDEMSGHGFRAMARTILDEVLKVRPDYIEHQLAHTVRDPNGRAYNRTAHLEERRAMMQTWADYLDGLKTREG